MASRKRSASPAPESVGRLANPKDLKLKPRKSRGSKFEPIVTDLLKNKGKAFVYPVPDDKDPDVYRGMIQTGVWKALDKIAGENHGLRPTISILEDNSLMIQLVEGVKRKRISKKAKKVA